VVTHIYAGRPVISQYWALANGALAALKKASFSTIVLEYFTTVSLPVPGWPGQGIYYTDIYPRWWLTLAGTTLAEPLDATSTQVSVTDGSVISANLATNPDVLVDGESMRVTAVNGNTLTVERGYYSTATAHAPRRAGQGSHERPERPSRTTARDEARSISRIRALRAALSAPPIARRVASSGVSHPRATYCRIHGTSSLSPLAAFRSHYHALVSAMLLLPHLTPQRAIVQP